MSKIKEYARYMRRSLEEHAHALKAYIKMAWDALSDADKRQTNNY